MAAIRRVRGLDENVMAANNINAIDLVAVNLLPLYPGFCC
jgi:hypothetical protein